ncbi:hypothetical protein [Thalassovita taeanensis]|uniref:Uncharacterized protein n=1 Tax=Thalassovita taeanensis TaxID=657014 RepID=A0A1H9FAT1_9RHOB|nr:hypothetical protein [Thalassovita taeanensis]SEQ35009.1 hypothetical protein SAMN04488092_10614 [Thalassovita taeanensis]
MSKYEQSRAYCRTVVALEPGSTNPSCPADARKMALAELMTIWEHPDPIWTAGLVLVAAKQITDLVYFADLPGPAQIDCGDLVAALGCPRVARMVLRAAGFYIGRDGKWTDRNDDLPNQGPAQKVETPGNFFAKHLLELAEAVDESVN